MHNLQPLLRRAIAALVVSACVWAPALAEAQGRGRPARPRAAGAPELDANLFVVALVLVLASVLVIRGRRSLGSPAA